MESSEIKSKREKMGLSQRAFAQLAGMSPAYLSRIERQEVIPKKRTLDKINKVFDLDQQKDNIASYYIQPSIVATNRARAVARFVQLLEIIYFAVGENKEAEATAAVLGFMEALELVTLARIINDSEMIEIMVESYYTYLKEIKSSKTEADKTDAREEENEFDEDEDEYIDGSDMDEDLLRDR